MLKKRIYNSEYHKEYYRKNKDKIIKRKKLYHQNNKDELNKKRRDYYKANQKKFNNKQRIYIEKNIENIRKRKRNYQRNKILQDVNYAIKTRLRSNLYHALKRYSTYGKIQSSIKYGIDYKAIIEHLKPFPKDLSIYDIDHIRPLCTFDLTDDEQVKEAFSPENLRWLYYKKNRSDGAKLVNKVHSSFK